MDDTEASDTPLAPRAEPPLIERARRIGWALLVVAVAAMLVARIGPEAVRAPAIAAAVAAGLFGLLAIVNVALVRGLYRQLNEMKSPPDAP
jgi:choline-glycine betaine transporter